MRHRTDIDGLRAVAIIPILLFHAGLSEFSGGFLGVDIFFVISGFLITSIIVRDLNNNAFFISDFYKRRIARIFPALFVVVSTVLAVSCITSMPFELEKTGWSSVASLTFVSNLYFWKTIDYFGGFAETIPLLHTWSLGVEEQFYIFYPLYLAVVARFFPGRLQVALVALIVASIFAALIMYNFSPQAAFYLLPARAWQLGLGGLVAVGSFPDLQRANRAICAYAGAGLIIVSTLVVRADWMLPFPWGAAPSFGAALLIAYGENSSVHRVLALPPMRWVGAISYSLYLWHWPIIAFYRIETGLELVGWEPVGLVVASIAVAAVSYYAVEQPALNHFRYARKRLTLSFGVGGIAILSAVAAFLATNPAGWRSISPEVERIAAFADYRRSPLHAAQYREGTCFSTEDRPALNYDFCSKLAPDRRNIALIGDSHAAQFWGTLTRVYPEANVIQLTSSGCRVILGSIGKERCLRLSEFVYKQFLPRGNVDQVILAGRWKPADLPDLLSTVRMLRQRNINVIVLGPIFEFEGEFPLLLARATEMGAPESMERFRIKTNASLDVEMARTVTQAGGQYYSVQQAECEPQCVYMYAGTPLHFDYGHLTARGADYLLRNLKARTQHAPTDPTDKRMRD